MTFEIKQDAKQSKIESIRLRIENGTYKIDAGDLADAIMQAMQKREIAEDEGRAA